MEDNQVTMNDSDRSNMLPDTVSVNSAQSSLPIVADEQEPVLPDTHLPLSIDSTFESLLKEMRQLRQDFDTKLKYDESKERLIESLHRELQMYREGLHFRVLRPVFTDLITMYDDIGKLIDSISSSSNINLDRMIHTLTMYQENIEEILLRNGVISFTMEGEAFLPSRQRILRVVPTPDPALAKQIARRVRKGFIYENIVLRAEVVETYKYIAPAE